MKRFPCKKRYVVLICWIMSCMVLAACGEKPQTYTIGIISALPVLEETVQGFKNGMTDMGYIEGENVTYIGGPVSMDEIEPALANMVDADVDLILTTTTAATQAAKRATSGADIPVVFTSLADPVGADIVDSIRAPGGNCTGIAFSSEEALWLELFTQIAPTMEKIYVPYNPNDPAPLSGLRIISEAAPKLGVELITREVRTTDELEAAVRDIPEDADGIFLLVDTLISSRIPDIIAASIERRIPMSGANADAIKQGTLTGYGPMQEASGRQTARLADQILRGAQPSSLPVEATEMYLGVNLETARAIGLEIPDTILRRADTIIR